MSNVEEEENKLSKFYFPYEIGRMPQTVILFKFLLSGNLEYQMVLYALLVFTLHRFLLLKTASNIHLKPI
jgi:hypothetical protein